jgi:hypothetical protein
MSTPTYRCEPCALLTMIPNWSDCSEPVYDADIGFRMVRTHIPVCPNCGRAVKTLPPLSNALIDIARMQI